MSRFTRIRDRATGSAVVETIGAAVGIPASGIPTGGSAAAEALTPDLNTPDMQALPDVPGPQSVPLRDPLLGQQLAASGVQATGSADLPGTGLFGPKKKAAARSLVGA